jgi:hypothetical protein
MSTVVARHRCGVVLHRCANRLTEFSGRDGAERTGPQSSRDGRCCLSPAAFRRRGPSKNWSPVSSSATPAGYVYFEEEGGRRAAAKLLTLDEVRRIAVNIANLPELLSKPRVQPTSAMTSTLDI